MLTMFFIACFFYEYLDPHQLIDTKKSDLKQEIVFWVIVLAIFLEVLKSIYAIIVSFVSYLKAKKNKGKNKVKLTIVLETCNDNNKVNVKTKLEE